MTLNLCRAAELKTKMSNEVIDVKIPDELTCKICKELVRDAVIIPCCSESFCDECKLIIIIIIIIVIITIINFRHSKLFVRE